MMKTKDERREQHRLAAIRRRRANPEKYRKASREWAKRNPEKVSEKNRAWRIANPEKARDATRHWIQNNRERQRATRNAWQARNREHICALRNARYASTAKERRAEASKKRREYKETLVALLGGKCTDCGAIPHIAAFDFDHVRGMKLHNIGTMIGNRRWEAIVEEALKCELVCANCHRIRTAERTGLV